jgi:hypothetical protein
MASRRVYQYTWADSTFPNQSFASHAIMLCAEMQGYWPMDVSIRNTRGDLIVIVLEKQHPPSPMQERFAERISAQRCYIDNLLQPRQSFNLYAIHVINANR